MIKKILNLNAIKTSVFRPQLAAVYVSGGMMEDRDWNDMAGWGGGLFFVMGGIMMILFWAVVILAAIALLRWLVDYLRVAPAASNKAMEILKEKYAKGEISKEEFETKKKDIM